MTGSKQKLRSEQSVERGSVRDRGRTYVRESGEWAEIFWALKYWPRLRYFQWKEKIG
jgi:hypothetical protein